MNGRSPRQLFAARRSGLAVPGPAALTQDDDAEPGAPGVQIASIVEGTGQRGCVRS
ncbi:hypothetical protein [Microtetraspora malaysiensis]|uniref:Uncharacterized protein n=1 Tax=Microtetraspora malaysiensis TaxID=161358 RepID=A0ABW6SS77_9ACTN